MPDRAASVQLELRGVSVRFGAKTAVERVSLRLERGEIGCLLGPSGCGKTSLLRAVAGLQPIATGELLLCDLVVNTSRRTLPPERRKVGMVFQDLALFPHLNVSDNVAFGLRGQPAKQVKARVEELLTLVGLHRYGDTYPHQLSGGQQQRIALIRAMAPRPELILMDEPFSSQDVELREQLARDVRRILGQEQITGLLVTHDQHEAFAMADNIGVMDNGKLHQWDSGYRLYHQPADLFVANFIGRGVLLGGNLVSSTQVDTSLGRITGKQPVDLPQGSSVRVLVRPDDVIPDSQSNTRAEVADKTFRGSEFIYTLVLPDGTRLLSLTPSHQDYAVGERIGIRLNVDHLVVFPAGDTQAAAPVEAST